MSSENSGVSEMVTGLYAMKIPRAFIITFAVAMRFFPTAKEEISYVRDAMSLRGIGFSLRNLRLRPALVFEGFISNPHGGHLLLLIQPLGHPVLQHPR